MSTDPWIKNIPSYTILTADTTWYVRTTGSDTTGDGSSGNPWATIQYAWDWIAANINLAGFDVTIDVGVGTFVGIIPSSITGGGSIVIKGDSKSTTSIDSGVVCYVEVGAVIKLYNLDTNYISTYYAYNNFYIDGSCSLSTDSVYGSINMWGGCQLNLGSLTTETLDVIKPNTGARICEIYLEDGGLLVVNTNIAVGGAAITYSHGFFYLIGGSVVALYYGLSGTVSGSPRARIESNSIIDATLNHTTIASAFGNVGDSGPICVDGGRIALKDLLNYTFPTAVTTLTDGATVNLDASLGGTFTLSAAGDRTLAPPTNPTSGQPIVITHTASGADRTLSLDTGTGGFRFGTDITALTATVSGKTDYIGCRYNAAVSKWDVVSYVKGF